MDTKDQILKGTKLIKKKYQKSKIKNLEQRLDSQKYNIKKKQSHKNYKIYVYMKFALKIGSFFLQGNNRL